MPTIIVEDGTGVEGANSYISVDDFRSFAADRGADYADSSDDEVGVWLILATDYIDSFEFVGIPEFEDQSLKWPRSNYGEAYEVPSAIVKAQSFAAMAAASGVVLQPTVEGGKLVIEEQIDKLRVKYASPTAVYSGPFISQVDSLLAPYLAHSSKANFSVLRG